MIQEKVMSRTLRLMFSSSVMLGLAVAAQPAFAQEKMEVVQVTGTRITTPGTSSNSPISSITAEEIKSSQPVAVEEFFKGLPAAVPAIGPGTNNGTGGGATIDLRGLGTNRTLVLVNGRRLVPFNLGGVVDTNSIPIALLSRVDIFTGGASVVYGADAVSGVVNFNSEAKLHRRRPDDFLRRHHRRARRQAPPHRPDHRRQPGRQPRQRGAERRQDRGRSADPGRARLTASPA